MKHDKDQTDPRESPCDCAPCCENRYHVARMLEREMARDLGPWSPPIPNAPFTLRLQ